VGNTSGPHGEYFWPATKCEIEIEYFGILAIDFPNGMKKGGEIKLNGKSIFEFNDEKIIRLTDIS